MTLTMGHQGRVHLPKFFQPLWNSVSQNSEAFHACFTGRGTSVEHVSQARRGVPRGLPIRRIAVLTNDNNCYR